MTDSRVMVSSTGYRETMKVLSELDPELRKQTRKEIRGAANVVRRDAIGRMPKRPPMSGWQTQPSTGGVGTNQHGVSQNARVRGGAGWMPWLASPRMFKVDIGRQRRQLRKEEWNVARLVGLGPSLQVFEFGGVKGGSGDARSRQFISNLDRFGKPGRSLWAAWDANRDVVDASMRAAVRQAESVVNVKLGRVG